jgi:hypothetical protein
MNIIQIIRDFLRWRNRQRALCDAIRPLVSIELDAYTYDECLLAAGHDKRIPHEVVGIVAQCLYCRCNRGKGTLEQALSLFGGV